MNEHDTERIAGLLEADGLVAAADEESADVVVLNTCCIRENADNKLYAKLGDLKVRKTENPGVQIAVAGCLAQKDRDTIRDRAGHVDVVFGTHNVHRAAELLGESRTNGPIVEVLEAAARDDAEAFPSALPPRSDAGYAAWLTIQVGCDNSCAYCIVPAVRGPELSRPLDDLVLDVAQMAGEGVTEVTLLGQNVNSYGRDLTLARRRQGEDVRVRPLFADLLRQVGGVEGIKRVRYVSPHPKDFRPETIAAMAETPAVCEHLHLPVQSGSDRVLAAMHRGYTAERYLEKLAAARSEIDDLAVTTDIIVGFPGETDDDFAATLELAAVAEFDAAFTYIYSERPGTEAAELTDLIEHAVSVERFEKLRAVLARSGARKHAERVGRIEEVVVEGVSKRNAERLTGRTRQNKVVHFDRVSSARVPSLRVGSYASIRVTESKGHYLMGEVVEVLAMPKHKVRIPVVAV